MTEQEMMIFCSIERFQPQRNVKRNFMRQTALNSSSNSFFCYIFTRQSDQEKEEDESDSKQLSKSNSKLDVNGGVSAVKTSVNNVKEEMDQTSAVCKKKDMFARNVFASADIGSCLLPRRRFDL
ncbi:hypothetical protein LXL04_035912 [Taraxacum kok-saghyz]